MQICSCINTTKPVLSRNIAHIPTEEETNNQRKIGTKLQVEFENFRNGRSMGARPNIKLDTVTTLVHDQPMNKTSLD